jgi:hypothetical protein
MVLLRSVTYRLQSRSNRVNRAYQCLCAGSPVSEPVTDDSAAADCRCPRAPRYEYAARPTDSRRGPATAARPPRSSCASSRVRFQPRDRVANNIAPVGPVPVTPVRCRASGPSLARWSSRLYCSSGGKHADAPVAPTAPHRLTCHLLHRSAVTPIALAAPDAPFRFRPSHPVASAVSPVTPAAPVDPRWAPVDCHLSSLHNHIDNVKLSSSVAAFLQTRYAVALPDHASSSVPIVD